VCVLLNVELDSPSPEEPPRVTVRGARPLAEVRDAARMLLTLDVHTAEALQELRLALTEGEATRAKSVPAVYRRGARAARPARPGFCARRRLAERLAQVEGLANVSLSARRAAAH
jgi:DNA polymerase-3 subunit alpha